MGLHILFIFEMSDKKKKIVVVSGYFNPLHVGHLEMISRASKLGGKLIVIVNNDFQVFLKGSVPFMSQKDRIKIIKSICGVDEVFLSIDKDKTVRRSLEEIKPDIFANGGDRKSIGDIPEYSLCQRLGIEMVDGLGNKIRASSEIISRAALLKEKKDLSVKDDKTSKQAV